MRVIDYFDRGALLNRDSLALESAEGRYTFDELQLASQKVAAGLAARGEHDLARVAVYSHNTIDAFPCILGAFRAGCIMGVGIGGLTDIESSKELMMKRGPRRISPHFIPKIMMNAVAGRISMRYGLRGPNFVTASACASSNHAMGLAMRSIKSTWVRTRSW